MSEQNNETPKASADASSAPRNSGSSSRRGILTLIVVFGGMFLIFFLFAAMLLVAVSDSGLELGREQIGVVEVKGPIMESKEVVRDLRRFENDERIRGIIVRIDSPGGAVAPSQEIFHAVAQAKKKKPLAVSMGSTAASGGYYIAIGSDMIFANAGTITGSIGVITQLFNIQKVMDHIDVEVNTVKTGPYKDAGSPFKEFTAQEELYFRNLIDDVYEQFVEDVAKARELEVGDVREVADGRVFTGRQAKKLSLVDEIGTFQDAVDWVAKQAKLEGRPKLVYPPEEAPILGDLLRTSVRSVVEEAKIQQTPVLEYRYIGPQ